MEYESEDEEEDEEEDLFGDLENISNKSATIIENAKEAEIE